MIRKALIVIGLLFFFYYGEGQSIKKVSPGVLKISIGEPSEFTPLSLMTDRKPATGAMEKLSQKELPFDLSDIGFKINRRGVVVSIPLGDNEQLYGFGLQMKSFNQNGLRKVPIVNDHPLNNLGYTHAPVPYYVSNKGYAILINTAQYCTFYCGGNQPKKYEGNNPRIQDSIKLSVNALYKSGKYNNNRVIVDVPGAKGIEVYVFVGKDMRGAVQRYNLFSGGGAYPPIWGLGVKYRVKADFGEDDVYKITHYFRKHRIPIDVIGLEPGWQTGAYPCTFVWNREAFPNPKKMLRRLKKEGFRVNLWEHAFVSSASPLYDTLFNRSANYLAFNGLVPDFADKKTRKIFADYHKNNLVNIGVSGFKLDECDNSDLRYGSARWSFPELSQFPSGINGEEMHQLFGLLYQKTLFDLFKSKNQRTYLDVRSSNALASPFPSVLYSDTYNLEDYVRMNCNIGFSGLLWSPEVREAASFKELVRRTKIAVLSAQTVFNCWYLKHPPWLQVDRGKNNEGILGTNADENENIIRDILNFRIALIPYLYNAFYEYHKTGLPVFRALVMDYPKDKEVFGLSDEYMIGEDILAAPIIGDGNKREVYLPKGDWYNYNTNEKFEGGESYTVSFGLSDIPLFVKDGTILPLSKPVQYVNKDTKFDIVCRVYGKPTHSAHLIEDDGVTFNYEKEAFNKVDIVSKDGKLNLIRRGNYPTKKYNLKNVKWIE